MRVEFQDANGALVARVRERRIDARSAAGLKQAVGARIDQGAKRIVLNLEEVDFLDSTCLGVLLSLLKRVAPGGTLALCGCDPAIVELLKLTRLDRVFPIFATESEALAGLA